ncbi:MAG: 50S ribosomal protein L4 [Patescibacteria group bacterium]
METKIYDIKGKEVDKMVLPEEVFGLPMNQDLVHQVVVSMTSNARSAIAHTKDRSEVSGGGIKPWRQKGTGRARHGSRRSPLWIGGGITFGPTKDKNYTRKINRKMKAKALFTVLSQKFRDGEVLFVDQIKFTEPKTKEAKSVLEKLSKIKGFEMLLNKRKNSAFIALGDRDLETVKSFNNFGNLEIDDVKNINPVELLTYKHLIITNPKESIDFLSSKLA